MTLSPADVVPATDAEQTSFEPEKPKKSRAASPAPKEKEVKDPDLKAATLLTSEALDKKSIKTQAEEKPEKPEARRVLTKKVAALAAVIVVVCALVISGACCLLREGCRARGLAAVESAAVPGAIFTSLVGAAAGLYTLRGKFGNLRNPLRRATAKKEA